ncbi:MAG: hypothetical protein QF441_13345 [Bacteriovoracaceae bacterium]|jgi:hypothetical protein|nr:hypothetical protein [Halobacteriovoraceae bacterium]MDP7321590.1 hypothetical protein [Bacteriovoracaceae bacterium]
MKKLLIIASFLTASVASAEIVCDLYQGYPEDAKSADVIKSCTINETSSLHEKNELGCGILEYNLQDKRVLVKITQEDIDATSLKIEEAVMLDFGIKWENYSAFMHINEKGIYNEGFPIPLENNMSLYCHD